MILLCNDIRLTPYDIVLRTILWYHAERKLGISFIITLCPYACLHKFPLPKKEQGETVFILIRRSQPPSQAPAWAPMWGPLSALRSARVSAPA